MRDEPTERDTEPVAPAVTVKQEVMESSSVEMPPAATIKQEVQVGLIHSVTELSRKQTTELTFHKKELFDFAFYFPKSQLI